MSVRMIIVFASLLSVFDFPSIAARAESPNFEFPANDRILLRNGDVVRGTVIAEEFGKYLQVLLINGNEKRLRWNEVQELRAEGRSRDSADVVETKTGDFYRGFIVAQEFGKHLLIQMRDSSEERIPWKNVKSVKLDPKPTSRVSETPVQQAASVQQSTPVAIAPVYERETDPEPLSAPLSGFQLRAGLAWSDITTEISSSSLKTGMTSGLRVGAIWSSNPKDYGYSLDFGLEYMVRSVELTLIGGTSSYSERLKVGSLVVPVISSFRVGQFSFGGGAYFGVALSRRVANDEEEAGAETMIEPIDYGLRAYAKFLFLEGASPFVGLGYDFGIANISKGTKAISNRGLLLDFGYSF